MHQCQRTSASTPNDRHLVLSTSACLSSNTFPLTAPRHANILCSRLRLITESHLSLIHFTAPITSYSLEHQPQSSANDKLRKPRNSSYQQFRCRLCGLITPLSFPGKRPAPHSRPPSSCPQLTTHRSHHSPTLGRLHRRPKQGK